MREKSGRRRGDVRSFPRGFRVRGSAIFVMNQTDRRGEGDRYERRDRPAGGEKLNGVLQDVDENHGIKASRRQLFERFRGASKNVERCARAGGSRRRAVRAVRDATRVRCSIVNCASSSVISRRHGVGVFPPGNLAEPLPTILRTQATLASAREPPPGRSVSVRDYCQQSFLNSCERRAANDR